MNRLVRVATSLPARIAVTAGLLTVLAVWIDWDSVADRIAEGSWELFVLGVLVVDCALVLGALRWYVFLRAGAVEATFLQTLRAYGIGMFANNFLPTGFGGDAARALIIRPAAASTGHALTSVIVDRASSLVCLVLLAWIAYAVSPADVPDSLAVVLGVATVAGVLTVAAALVAARWAARRHPGRVTGRVVRFVAYTKAFAGDRPVLVLTTVLGLAYQAVIVLATWILARAIDLELPFALLAVVAPLVIVLTLMPISIAGFGVREGAYVVLLGKAGVGAADATLVSLLSVAALAIATLPGAVAMVVPTRPVRRPAQ